MQPKTKCAILAFRRWGLTLVCVALTAAAASAETLSNGVFEVVYNKKDEAAARRTLEALGEMASEFADSLPVGGASVKVVICSTFEEFKGHAGRYAEHVSGFARSEKGFIAVKAPRIREAGGDYVGTVRHEFMHVLLARNTNSAYLPRWLNEGVCMVASKEYRWHSAFRVGKMYLQGRLLSFWELNGAFADPGRETAFDDAYAQSLLMTRSLIKRIGEERFWRVVRLTRQMDFADALRQEAGIGPLDFWRAWKRSLWRVSSAWLIVSGTGLFTLMALLTVGVYLHKRRVGQAILERWEEEEQDEVVAPWDLEGREPPYAWEQEEDEY